MPEVDPIDIIEPMLFSHRPLEERFGTELTNPEIVHEETLTMGIHEVVNQALTTGYLSIEAENRLRQLLQTTQYGVDEMNAFVDLQLAAMAGNIRQESREELQRRRESECALSCSAR